MSDDEDYVSSEDEDYVPSDGEAVSEEENSGEEENLDVLKEDGEPVKLGKRKRKISKTASGPRKRSGGIRLADDEGAEKGVAAGPDEANKELEEQIKKEQEQKKEEHQKKKADDLWSSFMSDVGGRPKKAPPPKSSGLGSLASLSKPIPTPTKSTGPALNEQTATSAASSSTPTSAKSTITVTKEYDFAGESVQVTKVLDVNSKEGKAELKRQEMEKEEASEQSTTKAAVSPVVLGGKKPIGAGLGSVLERINKKPKMGTLEKSKLDWESFKQKEGIDEELKIHNRGKQSYIERMHFLNRTDVRQFEIEKSLRQSTSKR